MALSISLGLCLAPTAVSGGNMVSTTPPEISATLQDGETLGYVAGVWGEGNIVVQVLRDGAVALGEHPATYVVKKTDVGKVLSVREYPSDAENRAVTSNAVTITDNPNRIYTKLTSSNVSNWTSNWGPFNATHVAASGSRKEHHLLTQPSDDRVFMSWNPQVAVADVEVFMRYDPETNFDSSMFIALRGNPDDSAGETAYRAGVHAQANTRSIRAFVNGGRTTLASSAYTDVSDREFCLRFRAEGSALKMKQWLAADAEPTDWTLTTTDSSITAAGLVGIVRYKKGDIKIFDIGIGLNGETAPGAPAEIAEAPSLISTPPPISVTSTSERVEIDLSPYVSGELLSYSFASSPNYASLDDSTLSIHSFRQVSETLEVTVSNAGGSISVPVAITIPEPAPYLSPSSFTTDQVATIERGPIGVLDGAYTIQTLTLDGIDAIAAVQSDQSIDFSGIGGLIENEYREISGTVLIGDTTYPFSGYVVDTGAPQVSDMHRAKAANLGAVAAIRPYPVPSGTAISAATLADVQSAIDTASTTGAKVIVPDIDLSGSGELVIPAGNCNGMIVEGKSYLGAVFSGLNVHGAANYTVRGIDCGDYIGRANQNTKGFTNSAHFDYVKMRSVALGPTNQALSEVQFSNFIIDDEVGTKEFTVSLRDNSALSGFDVIKIRNGLILQIKSGDCLKLTPADGDNQDGTTILCHNVLVWGSKENRTGSHADIAQMDGSNIISGVRGRGVLKGLFHNFVGLDLVNTSDGDRGTQGIFGSSVFSRDLMFSGCVIGQSSNSASLTANGAQRNIHFVDNTCFGKIVHSGAIKSIWGAARASNNLIEEESALWSEDALSPETGTIDMSADSASRFSNPPTGSFPRAGGSPPSLSDLTPTAGNEALGGNALLELIANQ